MFPFLFAWNNNEFVLNEQAGSTSFFDDLF